jgi:hypothetical protein
MVLVLLVACFMHCAVLAATVYGVQTGDYAPLKTLASCVGDALGKLFAKSVS